MSAKLSEQIVDERLQLVLVRALIDLLEAAGFSGGVLLALTNDRTLAIVSALEPHLRITPAELLLVAAARLEAGDTSGETLPGRGPMNG
jgi:hypothetical protein